MFCNELFTTGEMCKMEHETCGFRAISPPIWDGNPIWTMNNPQDNRHHGECCSGYTCINQMLGGIGKCVKGCSVVISFINLFDSK